jgi:hypothetical protein
MSDSRDVERRADSCHDTATNEARAIEGNSAGHRDRLLVWHDAVFAERAQIHEQFEFTAVRESGARCAVKGDCLRSTCKICLAQMGRSRSQ